MLTQPYSISNYFLGIPPKNCIIAKDILYYNEEGIQLYFDAYIPPKDNLPGNNSVIISIHGGGWSAADKGFTNKIQFNKYFAAQGYVVFDIQYGLDDINPFALYTPSFVKGNFTLDDMIRHIGVFTKYIANHSATYNANLDSVFITGGSSGGNLVCAVGLSYYNTSFSSFFSPKLNIKGIIPFYPANGIANRIGIYGSPELNQPISMVNENSPPCLLFHGTSDGIVMPTTSKALKNKYLEENNAECALILLLFAGHVLDYYFSGLFSQICLYYMERFLYLYR
jgi:acetyl esterase/lipase